MCTCVFQSSLPDPHNLSLVFSLPSVVEAEVAANGERLGLLFYLGLLYDLGLDLQRTLWLALDPL